MFVNEKFVFRIIVINFVCFAAACPRPQAGHAGSHSHRPENERLFHTQPTSQGVLRGEGQALLFNRSWESLPTSGRMKSTRRIPDPDWAKRSIDDVDIDLHVVVHVQHRESIEPRAQLQLESNTKCLMVIVSRSKKNSRL